MPAAAKIVRGMLHTEEDPFACLGPFGASRGIDWDLIIDPSLPPPDKPAVLSGGLPWRTDGQGYRPEVIELAEKFGYDSGGESKPAPDRLKIVPPLATSLNDAVASQ